MSIVCGTDFGEAGNGAAEAAARLAARRKERLFLVHALQLPAVTYIAGEPIVMASPEFVQPNREEMEAHADEKLASEARRLMAISGGEVVPRLVIESPAEALLRVAKEEDARMIVTGTRSVGIAARWLLGSTSDRVARRSNLPVMVVHEPWDGLFEWSRGERPLRVLFGVDFEESFEFAARAAKILLDAGPCELHYVHVFDVPPIALFKRETELPLAPATPEDIDPALSRELDRLIAEARLPASEGRIHLLHGRPARAITAYAKKHAFDLVLVGTHSRTGLERALLGSVALAVLHDAPCPVLVAPAR